MFSIINGIIFAMQALLLDWVIFRFSESIADAKDNGYTYKGNVCKAIEMFATVIALIGTYSLY